MVQNFQPTLLAIGVDGMSDPTSKLDVYTATTIREAIATMRLINFDLLVVGLDDPALDVAELMHRVLTVRPHQRWILMAQQFSANEEVLARSLGALMVLHEIPSESWLVRYVTSLRELDLSRNLLTPPYIDVPSVANAEATPVESF
jgi:DNA-binding NarL/FixJ family response regulator